AETAIQSAQIKGLEVLSLTPLYHLHDQITGLCEEFGAKLVRDYEGTSLDALRIMVGMEMGVTFVPALYARSEIEGQGEVVVRPIKSHAITRSVGLVWRKTAGRASAYRQIARTIKDVVARDFKALTIEA
ncbi:MAG: LysR substrate-binding domain-containing protein, partial [Pseudomonadota bacterium]